MSKVTTVAGLEMYPRVGNPLDTDPSLVNCRHCGALAGFRWEDRRLDRDRMLRVECSNTSCGIMTPFHYHTREDAAYAWNRKPGDPPKRG